MKSLNRNQDPNQKRKSLKRRNKETKAKTQMPLHSLKRTLIHNKKTWKLNKKEIQRPRPNRNRNLSQRANQKRKRKTLKMKTRPNCRIVILRNLRKASRRNKKIRIKPMNKTRRNKKSVLPEQNQQKMTRPNSPNKNQTK